ncbi:MAG: hypothetical protein EOS58_02915 [Mesorhizobium sp.]|uniref:hypothetical protein n=1 Tax=unclassified Mesorhizobium TaxID=325217 RepID=UPI000F763DDD|nr:MULTISPECIES: hypothetical protein [unclassified Mesorhizobium]RVD68350.1 hypothetical protein EN751_31885 [Mesorhizobium sp. M4A.F.Ca.ET.029.04.2.1]AZO51133.1 hypothetical protein EJ073_27980 [Mesorhizobium sp. M4B.F.Ca.ET.058.02.1.1]RUX49336.1 hypothetical protein EOA33_12845 [Mesorhizobium sp. M4A.F.Ca.ET.050.02.1.1]RVC41118.1 hypothetical protein EN781_27300 [Mesorhizobium sp. M4A.F.Ca.ET.090.04.2.1]RVC79436.1 hypothetical protein EN745_15970 [Mesorhizobium sp. M4A.F.Ca.ET.022.05.2.1]
MIKFIAAAIWICAATLGAVFYSFQAAGKAGVGEPPKPMLGGLDYVKTDIISVPLIRDARIDGYFLTKLVYTVEPEQIKKLSIPADALITDQVYSYLYANPQVDFTKKDTIDLDAFRKSIQDSINARVGVELVHEVLIDQVNFLSKDEIRDNAIRRRKGAGETASEMTKPFKQH